VPILQKVFQTTGLGWQQWAVLALFAPIMLISDELRKMFSRRVSADTAMGGAK